MYVPLSIGNQDRDPPNAPCSAERSGEGSVIFSEFIVPLFKGEEQGRYGKPLFSPFLRYSIITQPKKIYKLKKN